MLGFGSIRLFVIACLLPSVSYSVLSASPKNAPSKLIRVCDSQRPSFHVFSHEGEAGRTVSLAFSGGREVTIRPSVDIEETGESFDVRFDYQVALGDGKPPVHLSMMKNSPDEQDDIAYRFLQAVGVACSGSNGAFVYISLATNGSNRDYFYTGFHVGGMNEKLLPLGKSSYGVLAISISDPFRFSIWDSSEETEANSMGPHDYDVSYFRWIDEKRGAGFRFQPLGNRRRNQLFPGCLLEGGDLSIRVGEPSQKRCK
jgi:hypothetical protein